MSITIKRLTLICERGIINMSSSSLLAQVTKNAKSNIDSSELYSQQEVIDRLGISRNTFKKYFSNDAEWFDKACLTKGRAKYFKGIFLIYKAIDLSAYEYNENFWRAVEEAEQILAPYEMADVVVHTPAEFEKTVLSWELEESLGELNDNYWKMKLEDKPS